MEGEQCFAPLLDRTGKPVRIITNESAIGIFTGVAYPDCARKSAVRLMRDDLLTDYGVRTRSIEDPNFRENGVESYHRGTVWPQMDTMFALGCDKYGFVDVSSDIKNRTVRLVTTPGFGCIELASVSLAGDLGYYREKGKAVACFDQTWVIHGVIGITTESSGDTHRMVA